MASTLWLRAETHLTHRGNVVTPGTVFEATKGEATQYAYRRQVSFVKPADQLRTRQMTAASEPDPFEQTAAVESTPRRKYRRRDLTAEGTGA